MDATALHEFATQRIFHSIMLCVTEQASAGRTSCNCVVSDADSFESCRPRLEKLRYQVSYDKETKTIAVKWGGEVKGWGKKDEPSEKVASTPAGPIDVLFCDARLKLEEMWKELSAADYVIRIENEKKEVLGKIDLRYYINHFSTYCRPVIDSGVEFRRALAQQFTDVADRKYAYFVRHKSVLRPVEEWVLSWYHSEMKDLMKPVWVVVAVQKQE